MHKQLVRKGLKIRNQVGTLLITANARKGHLGLFNEFLRILDKLIKGPLIPSQVRHLHGFGICVAEGVTGRAVDNAKQIGTDLVPCAFFIEWQATHLRYTFFPFLTSRASAPPGSMVPVATAAKTKVRRFMGWRVS